MPCYLFDIHQDERHSLWRSASRVGLLAAALSAAWPVQAADDPVTFVQAATRAGMLKIFLGLIDKAQLADRLNARPTTVFPPTDDAFAHLTPAQRDAIAALSPDDAKRFVSHFIVPGVALKSNNIDQNITTEDGTSYNVTWFMGRLSLRDHRGPAPGPLAFVVDGDNPAGPGMIDAVDNVLMPTFLDQPASADVAVTERPGMPLAPVPPPAPPPSASPAPGMTMPTPAPPAAALLTSPTSTPATPPPLGEVTSPELKPAQPVAPPQPKPTPPPVAPVVTATPARPDINITTADIRGWPVRTSSNGPTGKVDRVVVGIPSGHITGLMATFGGFLGIGGKHAFIAWPLVTVDPQGKTIRVRMTAADLQSAPSSPPAP